MKIPLFVRLASWLLVSLATSYAFDWPAALKSPGAVEVTNMTLQPLIVGNEDQQSWLSVPNKLLEAHAQGFTPTEKKNGVAEYRVTKDGWIFVAGYFGNEGAKRGDWVNERWEQKDFEQDGWIKLSTEEAGGALMNQGQQSFDIFAKQVKAGASGRLRVNKYSAPRFILLPAAPQQRPDRAARASTEHGPHLQ